MSNAAPSTAPELPADAAMVPTPSGPNVFGVIALALAAVGFVLGVVPGASGFAWLLVIPAIVFAIIGLTRKGRPKKLALAGLIVAIIGWLVAIIVTVVTVVAGLGTGVDGINAIPDAPVSGLVGGIGAPITNADGVSFTLDAVQCGLASTGADFFAETPNGEWCRVDYTVANGGSVAVSMLAGDIKGYVGGTAFEADDATGKFGDDYFTTDLNPGLSAPCVVFIDVPVGTSLDSVGFAPVLSFSDQVLANVG